MEVPRKHAVAWTWTRRSKSPHAIDKEERKAEGEARQRRDDAQRGRDDGAWPCSLFDDG